MLPFLLNKTRKVIKAAPGDYNQRNTLRCRGDGRRDIKFNPGAFQQAAVKILPWHFTNKNEFGEELRRTRALVCLDYSAPTRVATSVPQRVAITLPLGSRISTLTVEV